MSDAELLHEIVAAIRASGADQIVCKDVYISLALRNKLFKWENLQKDEEIKSLVAERDELLLLKLSL